MTLEQPPIRKRKDPVGAPAAQAAERQDTLQQPETESGPDSPSDVGDHTTPQGQSRLAQAFSSIRDRIWSTAKREQPAKSEPKSVVPQTTEAPHGTTPKPKLLSSTSTVKLEPIRLDRQVKDEGSNMSGETGYLIHPTIAFRGLTTFDASSLAAFEDTWTRFVTGAKAAGAKEETVAEAEAAGKFTFGSAVRMVRCFLPSTYQEEWTDDETIKNFATLKQKVMAVLGINVNKQVNREKFNVRQQQSGETPREYLRQLKRLGTLAGIATDPGFSKLVADVFRGGLRREYRAWLFDHKTGKVADDDDPVKLLALCDECDERRQVVEEERPGLNRLQPMPKKEDDNRQCYNCGQTGHLRRDCTQKTQVRREETDEQRQPPRSNRYYRQVGARLMATRFFAGPRRAEGSSVRCYNCNGVGHIARDCRGRQTSGTSGRGRDDRMSAGSRGAFQRQVRWGGNRATPQLRRIKAASMMDQSLVVDARVNDKMVRFIVDTGAAVSAIRSDMVDLHESERLQAAAVNADGTEIPIRGQIPLRVTMGTFDADHTFIVLDDLQAEGLLGYDFIKDNNIVVDIPGQQLKRGERVIPCKNVRGTAACRAPMRAVRLNRDCVIPPQTRVTVLCDVRAPENATVLIKPTPRNRDTDEEPALIFGHAVDRVVDGRVRIPVMNLGTKEERLHPQEAIGSFEVIKEKNIRKAGPSHQSNNNRGRQAGLWDPPVDLSSKRLTGAQRQAVKDLIRRYSDIFSRDDDDNGFCPLVEHKIRTDGPPIRQPLRRSTHEERQIMRQEVERMEKMGVIRPSRSSWASAVCLVKKRDGKFRFAVDYRVLNTQIAASGHYDPFPLPRIDDTLDALGGAKYFSTFDLQSGYWNVPMEEESKHYTAFLTPWGLYEWNVMPFGLNNAPATFQRLMQFVFHGMLFEEVLIYLDDIITFSTTFEEHLERLERTFQRIREAGLKLKPKKCHIAKEEVEFLGYLVSDKGVRPDPNKVAPVMNFPRPRDVSQVRSFMGICSYYRRFIRDFAKIAEPLIALTRRSEVGFQWTDEAEAAFKQLKECLTSPPVLGYPQFDKPFKIYSDASNWAIGAVLAQDQGENGGDKREVVIAYASRQLSKTERNYCATERELLGIYWAVKTFRPYIRINDIVYVYTDHNPIAQLNQARDSTGKLARYKMLLQEYNIQYIYKPGKTHTNADGLSRTPPGVKREADEEEDEAERPGLNTIGLRAALTEEVIRREQERDEWVQTIRESATRRANETPPPPGYWVNSENGLLMRTSKRTRSSTGEAGAMVVLPESLVEAALRQAHEEQLAHLGAEKTAELVATRFFFPKLDERVRRFVECCVPCQRKRAAPPGHSPLQHISEPSYPLEKVCWDVAILPQSYNGNTRVLFIGDMFTKYIKGYAMKDEKTKTIVRHFLHLTAEHGCIGSIHNDQGRNFESKTIEEICKALGIEQTRTTAYHPQGNGFIERFNRTIKSMMAKTVDENQRDWDVKLPWLLQAYNAASQDSTGYTPYYLFHGRPFRFPRDVLLRNAPKFKSSDEYATRLQAIIREAYEEARTAAEAARTKQKKFHDAEGKEHEGFTVGQLVLLHEPLREVGKSPKLHCPYTGLYFITAKTGPVTYAIRLLDGKAPARIVNMARLKPFNADSVEAIVEATTGPRGKEEAVAAIQDQSGETIQQPDYGDEELGEEDVRLIVPDEGPAPESSPETRPVRQRKQTQFYQAGV